MHLGKDGNCCFFCITDYFCLNLSDLYPVRTLVKILSSFSLEVLSVYEVGPSCDWWSLGVLLFELLTSKVSFSVTSTMKIPDCRKPVIMHPIIMHPFCPQPLHLCHPNGITTHTLLAIPNDLSSEAQSLLHEVSPALTFPWKKSLSRLWIFCSFCVHCRRSVWGRGQEERKTSKLIHSSAASAGEPCWACSAFLHFLVICAIH